MEDEKEKLCRLCLKTLNGKNCEEIGEITKEILDVLLVTPDLNVTEERAICISCIENIQNSFHFKATCFYTEDYIVPFLRSDSTKLDLKELYMDQNAKLNALKISADEKICRLCLDLVTNECLIHLGDVRNMLVKCIPELDFNSTREPVICTDCLRSLRHYFRFLENCLGTEEQIRKYCNLKRKGNSGHVKLSRVAEFMQKESNDGSLNMVENEKNCLSGKGNIKSNNSETNTIVEKSENLGKEGNGENQIIESLAHTNTESAEVKLYKCGSCSFKTKYRGNFKKHEILHKDPSEIQWFKCALCPYKEKCKRYLINHLETHKNDKKGVLKQSETFVKKHNDSVNLKLYKCGNCSFQTKYSGNLSKHQVIHKDPSEIKWFKCALCPYKAIRKSHLIYHSTTHKKKKKERQTIFKCDKCMYKSKWKVNVQKHAQTHEDLETFKIYRCEVCSFKSRFQRDVNTHMRKHVNTKDVKCEICTFKTKYIESLKRHMMSHKNPSELTKYKCEICAYETVWKISFSKHILLKHTDRSKLEELKCEKCNYKSYFRDYLNQHIRWRHKK